MVALFFFMQLTIKNLITLLTLTATLGGAVWTAASWVTSVNDQLNSLKSHETYYHGSVPAEAK